MKIINAYSSDIGKVQGCLQSSDSEYHIFNARLNNEYFDIPKSESKKISVNFSGNIKTGIIITNKFWAGYKDVIIEKGMFIEDRYED